MSKYNVVSVQNFNQLWQMFLEYHKEISFYAGEMPIPEKNHFLQFWQQENKWTYFLTHNGNPIGFVLLQVILQNEKKVMELGAIFVRKEKRGIHSLKLYKTSLNCPKQNNTPLESEIAIDNEHSIKIYNLLKKKYAQNTRLVFKEKKLNKNRIIVSCQSL